MEASAPADPGDLVTFIGCPIEVTLPEHSTSGVPEAELSVDNVSRLLMPQIRRANETTEPIMATYREYLLSRRTIGPELVVDGFAVRRARATLMRVSASLGFFDLLNARWPTEIYTTEDYRGLGQR